MKCLFLNYEVYKHYLSEIDIREYIIYTVTCVVVKTYKATSFYYMLYFIPQVFRLIICDLVEEGYLFYKRTKKKHVVTLRDEGEGWRLPKQDTSVCITPIFIDIVLYQAIESQNVCKVAET